MSELYYQVSHGLGGQIDDDGISVSDECLPDGHNKWSDDEFTLFVFGHEVDSDCANNRVFPYRNLIANLHCTCIGKDRTNIPKQLHNVVFGTDAFLNDIKPIVIVDSIVGSGSPDSANVFAENDVRVLFTNLYNIVKREVKNKFGVDDISVCWLIPDEDYESFENYMSSEKPKGCDVKFSGYSTCSVLFYNWD